MGAQQHVDIPASLAGPAGRPVPVSRRSVLRSAAGAGAVGAACLVVGGALGAVPAAAATRPARRAPDSGRAGADRVVVHVRDARTGEIDVFAGTSHTRLRDPGLAAQLAGLMR